MLKIISIDLRLKFIASDTAYFNKKRVLIKLNHFKINNIFIVAPEVVSCCSPIISEL